jgi:hypothetical protein
MVMALARICLLMTIIRIQLAGKQRTSFSLFHTLQFLMTDLVEQRVRLRIPRRFPLNISRHAADSPNAVVLLFQKEIGHRLSAIFSAVEHAHGLNIHVSKNMFSHRDVSSSTALINPCPLLCSTSSHALLLPR